MVRPTGLHDHMFSFQPFRNTAPEFCATIVLNNKRVPILFQNFSKSNQNRSRFLVLEGSQPQVSAENIEDTHNITIASALIQHSTSRHVYKINLQLVVHSCILNVLMGHSGHEVCRHLLMLAVAGKDMDDSKEFS